MKEWRLAAESESKGCAPKYYAVLGIMLGISSKYNRVAAGSVESPV